MIIPVVTQVVLPAVTQVALPAVIQVALPAVIQVVVLPVVIQVVVLPVVIQVVVLPVVIQVVVLPVVIQVALPAEILLSNHTVQAYDIYRKVSTGPATGSSFQMHDNKKLREQNVSAVLLYLTSKRMYNSLKALKNQFRSSTDTGIIS